MGDAGEGQNITHQQKSMDIASLKAFRDRFDLPLTDAQVEKLNFYRPAEDSPEMQYMLERRNALGGYVPQRRRKGNELTVPQRSEEHTSELQSLMRHSYAVFCLKKKKKPKTTHIQRKHKT